MEDRNISPTKKVDTCRSEETHEENLQASPTEMFSGTSLRIQGEFIDPKTLLTVAFQDFVTELRHLLICYSASPSIQTQRLSSICLQSFIQAARATTLWPSITSLT